MRLLINGISGKMGRVIKDLAPNSQVEIVGYDTQNEGIETFKQIIQSVEAVIDFTCADYALDCAEAAANAKVPFITGTTGFSDNQMQQLHSLATHSIIFSSFNMSVEMNKFIRLCAQAARDFSEYDCEIVEHHHNQKLDVISGTAKMIANKIAEARGGASIVLQRKGKRTPGEIGVTSLRLGSVFGIHKIYFSKSGSGTFELSHESSGRNEWAQGAIDVALWAVKQQPGKLLNMDDFLA